MKDPPINMENLINVEHTVNSRYSVITCNKLGVVLQPLMG